MSLKNEHAFYTAFSLSRQQTCQSNLKKTFLHFSSYLLFAFSLLFFQSAAYASSLSSMLNESTQDDEIQLEQAEFLKVDEAFVYSSENTAEGIKLKWDIADEYYLYKERFKFKVTSDNKEHVTLGDPQFSQKGEPKEDPYFGLVHVIYNKIEVFLPVTLQAGQTEAEIKITSQGCAEAGLCYPPKHEKILFLNEGTSPSGINGATQATNDKTSTLDNPSFEDASSVFSFIQTSSLSTIFGIFLLLGIGLTFTPCVFPMIPIITSIIAGQEKPTVTKSFLLALSYVLGMAITYSIAGVLTGILGASANIQAALQDPILISVFAGLFVILALSMFGIYELQLPAFLRDRLNSTSQNLSGGHVVSVFFIGALSALVVSPCVSAPLAGALLYISSTGDALIGGASLFALGLGMGVPLILIAVGGGKFLPKAGAWMDSIKHVFGAMLIAVAIWLLSRIISDSASLIVWSIFLGIVATQLGAFDAAVKGWPRLFKGFGLLLALYSAMLLIGGLTGAKDPLKPLEALTSHIDSNTGTKLTAGAQTGPSLKSNFNVIYDLDGLNEELKKAQALNRPVLLDFYADWCISCKVMENNVFPLPDISQRMGQFHLVKADVTDNSTGNQTLMTHFNLFGPPSILFFDRQGQEIVKSRIVGEISKNAYLNTLNDALTSS